MAEHAFKLALQKAVFACSTSLDALKAKATSTQPEDTSLTDARSDFISILSIIYVRSTSLALVLKADPVYPSAAQEPLTDIAQNTVRLAHCAAAFLVSGPTIQTEAIWAAQEVIESMQTFLVGLVRASHIDSESVMLRVGMIHSAIDRVKGSLSIDNRAAVAKRWQADASHLDDAVREIKEMIEDSGNDSAGDSGDFDDGWAEIMDGPGGKLAPEETEVAQKVMILLRIVALLHKRTMTRLVLSSTQAPGVGLEDLLALSGSLVAGSDDLAAALWSPQDTQQVISCARLVQDRVHRVRQLLMSSGLLPSGLAEHLNEETPGLSKDAEWFKMCFDQIDKAVRSIAPNP